jgi:hypothetical protein
MPTDDCMKREKERGGMEKVGGEHLYTNDGFGAQRARLVVSDPSFARACKRYDIAVDGRIVCPTQSRVTLPTRQTPRKFGGSRNCALLTSCDKSGTSLQSVIPPRRGESGWLARECLQLGWVNWPHPVAVVELGPLHLHRRGCVVFDIVAISNTTPTSGKDRSTLILGERCRCVCRGDVAGHTWGRGAGRWP